MTTSIFNVCLYVHLSLGSPFYICVVFYVYMLAVCAPVRLCMFVCASNCQVSWRRHAETCWGNWKYVQTCQPACTLSTPNLLQRSTSTMTARSQFCLSWFLLPLLCWFLSPFCMSGVSAYSPFTQGHSQCKYSRHLEGHILIHSRSSTQSAMEEDTIVGIILAFMAGTRW